MSKVANAFRWPSVLIETPDRVNTNTIQQKKFHIFSFWFLLQAVFDPEIFFYVLLPPIIFYAGYDMKKVFEKKDAVNNYIKIFLSLSQINII